MSVTVILKAPGQRISLCPNSTAKAGKIYVGWQVRESVKGGPVVRRTFAREQEAVRFARRRAKVLLGQATLLPQSDLMSFRAGLINLYGTGVNIEQATAEYALAKRELAGLPVSLVDVARFYRAHHRGGVCEKTVAEVVAELLERRRKENASQVHLSDLKNRLSRFAKDVSCPIASLSAPVIQAWLDGLKVSNRTVRNYRNAVSNLVGFAKVKEYLPAEFGEMSRLEKIVVRNQPIQIFTPTEMLHLLRHANDSVLPVIVLGGFAGLRTSETLLLNWDHIDWQQDSIIVPPEGKTQERRVPMEPNLRAWLEPLRGVGRIVPISLSGVIRGFERTVVRANRTLTREKVKLELTWKNNALRHSAVSYWMRLHENPHLVASWTGHSVGTLKRHYCNKTVTNEAAHGWWAIQPVAGAVQLSLFTGPAIAVAKSCPESVRKEGG